MVLNSPPPWMCRLPVRVTFSLLLPSAVPTKLNSPPSRMVILSMTKSWLLEWELLSRARGYTVKLPSSEMFRVATPRRIPPYRVMRQSLRYVSYGKFTVAFYRMENPHCSSNLTYSTHSLSFLHDMSCNICFHDLMFIKKLFEQTA